MNQSKGTYYDAHPKFQNFQDPQDIFPDCFYDQTTYKFSKKQQPLITEHLKNTVTVVHTNIHHFIDNNNNNNNNTFL